MNTQHRASALAMLVVTATLTACSTAPGLSGAAADPVTLIAAWGNGPGGVGSDVLDALTRSSSPSSITVSEPTMPTGDATDEEGNTLAVLADGDADISVIRADRLATAGAHSIQALTAPLVVTNEDQALAIAADPVAAEAMADLRDIGLVGLALAPGGMRYLFGYQTPFETIDDLSDVTVNTRVGVGVDAIIESIGARTDHSVGGDRTDAAAAGSLRGIEVSLQQYQAVDRPAAMLTNVPLYEKFDVVVIRASAYDSLTQPQRDELSARVAGAIESALTARGDSASAFAEWCKLPGATAAPASPELTIALNDRIGAVATTMMADAELGPIIDRMAQLHDGTTDAELGACSESAQANAGTDKWTVTPEGAQTVLDGVWRAEATIEDFESLGVGYHDAAANAGVWTFTIANGRAVIDAPNGPDCLGQFNFAGEEISVVWSIEGNDNCMGAARGTFSRTGDTVYIEWVTERDGPVGVDQAIFGGGLVKVGDG